MSNTNNNREEALQLFHELGLAVAMKDDTFTAHGEKLHPHSRAASEDVIRAAARLASAYLTAVGFTEAEKLDAVMEQIEIATAARQALHNAGLSHN